MIPVTVTLTHESVSKNAADRHAQEVWGVSPHLLLQQIVSAAGLEAGKTQSLLHPNPRTTCMVP